MPHIIGIDLGGTSAKFGLFTKEGKQVRTASLPTGIGRTPQELIHEMAICARDLLAKENISEEELAGIGIGVPGPVVGQSTVNTCVNLGWDIVNVKEGFQKEGFTCPILVGNDANVAAMGEIWQGAGAKFASVVYVIIGTGVGGGIVVNHKLVEGMHGAGGEIGHMPLLEEPLESACGCGGHRCLEQVSSATGMIRQAREALHNTDAPSLLRGCEEKLDTKILFDAAAQGDEISRKVIAYSAETLGRALAILSAVVDPEAFVLGGGVAEAGEALLQPVRAAYAKMAFPNTADTLIVKATLGNQAGITGAAALIALSGETQA